MFKWLRSVFSKPRDLERFEEKLDKVELTVVNGKVVCNYCHDMCNRCFKPETVSKLQTEYEMIVSTM